MNNFLKTIILILTYLLSLTIPISISVMCLIWINKMEKNKCLCSFNSYKDYIKFFQYFYLSLIIINVLYILFNNQRFNILKYDNTFTILGIFATIIGLLSLTNIIISIIYIYNLKKK